VLLDKRSGKATQKRWGWVKKGVPLILEIGGRDAAGAQVSVVRRDRLYREDGKVNFVGQGKEEFLGHAAAELEDVQRSLYAQAKAYRDANIRRDVTDMAGLEAHFAEGNRYPGWVELAWSRPTGEALEGVVQTLKALKLTVRNTPMDGGPVSGTCPFTGDPAVERIYVARAY
jgi:prolyl-tRNA synthetase